MCFFPFSFLSETPPQVVTSFLLFSEASSSDSRLLLLPEFSHSFVETSVPIEVPSLRACSCSRAESLSLAPPAAAVDELDGEVLDYGIPLSLPFSLSKYHDVPFPGPDPEVPLFISPGGPD